MVGKDKEIKSKIDELIAKSMSNYYFEQIGNELLMLRKNLDDNSDARVLLQRRDKVKELIKAFNHYSHKKVTLKDAKP